MPAIHGNRFQVKSSTPELPILPDPLSIVSVGTDQQLLDLREEIIRSIGLGVESVTPDEAYWAAHCSSPHVWIFCSTIEVSKLICLASAVRKNSPRSKLLLLEGLNPVGSEIALFHDVLNPTSNIDMMLKVIREFADGMYV